MPDVQLEWTDNSETETSFNIYRGTSSGFALDSGNLIAEPSSSSGTGTVTYTDEGISTGTEYFYVVTAESDAGESGASNEVSAFVPILSAPTNVSASNIGDASADLSWTVNDGEATAHRVYLKEPGDERTGVSLSTETEDVVVENSFELPESTLFIEFLTTSPSQNIGWVLNKFFDSADGWGITVDGGNVEVYDDIDGPDNVAYSEPINSGEVVVAAVELYSDGSSRFFVNGSEIGNSYTASDSLASFGGELYIGSRGDGSNGVRDATIYRAGVYENALTTSEHNTLASGGLPTNGLVGYWPLDLIQSGTTPDLSGYANDGTVNGPTLTGPVLFDATGALGGSANSATVSSLVNGQLYEAYVHSETTNNAVRDQ